MKALALPRLGGGGGGYCGAGGAGGGAAAEAGSDPVRSTRVGESPPGGRGAQTVGPLPVSRAGGWGERELGRAGGPGAEVGLP